MADDGDIESEVVRLNNRVGPALYAQDRYWEAIPLADRAIKLARDHLGYRHPHFATALNNRAALHQAVGEFTAAEYLYLQSLALRRAAHGAKHQNVGQALNNLATLHRQRGDVASAERRFREALEVRRHVFGERHPSVAQTLTDLAALYRATASYDRAHGLLGEALDIQREKLDVRDPDYARTATLLALVWVDAGNYALARQVMEGALKAWREALGDVHLHVATGLANLATIDLAQHDYPAAESHLEEALHIEGRLVGEEHQDFARSLGHLASAYLAQGKYDAAMPLFRRALDVQLASLGDQHPRVAETLEALFVLYAATGRKEEARAALEQAAAVNEATIGEVFSFGSEAQRTEFVLRMAGDLNAYLSLVLRDFSDSHEVAGRALDLTLRRKGLGAEALAAQRDAVLGGRYPQLVPRLEELRALRAEIAQRTLAGARPHELEAHTEALDRLRAQRQALEGELASKIPEIRLEERLRAVDRRVVARALPPKSVLVEFIRFNEVDFKAVPASGESLQKPARYVAFVLRAGEPDEVAMVDLGEVALIDRMVAAWRSVITGEQEGRGRRAAGAGTGPSGTDDGVALRRMVIDPLVAALGGRQRMFLAPDGDLTRLPFEVLPTEEDGHLIDAYRISYLSTGRDTVRFTPEAPVSGVGVGPPVVAADPDFDLGTGRPGTGNDGGTRGRRSRDWEAAGVGFKALPGTRLEGEWVGGRLGVKPWLGASVLEASLKACRSPQVVHLATHGFFLADQEPDGDDMAHDLDTLGSGGMRLSGRGLENPLLRSGLALAGANTWLRHERAPEEAEDGILTAEDVSGLDLLGTELVVLSACETGLGQIRVGEGVFGLRRAFAVAGAKTLVMSLWKVPDEETRQLMEYFYTGILAGASRADALRDAQLSLKAKEPDPYFWGAFICQGDPTPLRPPATLPEIVRSTGLRFAEQPNLLAVPFEGKTISKVVVRVSEVAVGVTALSVTLPKPGRSRIGDARRSLLRVSYHASYVKGAWAEGGLPALVVELPTETLTPPIAGALMRDLARLGDVKKRDLSDWRQWEERIGACLRAQEREIARDPERATKTVSTVLRSAGFRFEESSSGAFVTELQGRSLRLAIHPSTRGVAFMVRLGRVPDTRDRENYLAALLELNVAADIARIGISEDDHVALLCDVPELSSAVFDLIQAQFGDLLGTLLGENSRPPSGAPDLGAKGTR